MPDLTQEEAIALLKMIGIAQDKCSFKLTQEESDSIEDALGKLHAIANGDGR